MFTLNRSYYGLFLFLTAGDDSFFRSSFYTSRVTFIHYLQKGFLLNFFIMEGVDSRIMEKIPEEEV